MTSTDDGQVSLPKKQKRTNAEAHHELELDMQMLKDFEKHWTGSRSRPTSASSAEAKQKFRCRRLRARRAMLTKTSDVCRPISFTLNMVTSVARGHHRSGPFPLSWGEMCESKPLTGCCRSQLCDSATGVEARGQGTGGVCIQECVALLPGMCGGIFGSPDSSIADGRVSRNR